jgi:hypothetical protein
MLKIKECIKPGKYHSFTLQAGMYYGFDDKGCFATSLILEKHKKRQGGYYTVKLYRMDNNADYSSLNAAWYEVWEASETTRSIIQAANANGKFTFGYGCNISRFPTVRTGQVKNQGVHTVGNFIPYKAAKVHC